MADDDDDDDLVMVEPRDNDPIRLPNGKRTYYCIPDDEREAGRLKVEQLITDGRLDNDPDHQIHITGDNDLAGQGTIDRYGVYWRGFVDFCFAIGDYESAMIFLREICPSHPPPSLLETVIHFLIFQVLLPTKTIPDPVDSNKTITVPNVLLHYKTRRPVLKAKKNPNDPNERDVEMVCQGNWNCPSTIQMYASAARKPHTKHETTNCPYSEACDECISYRERERCACPNHMSQGGARIRRVGNPRYHADFECAMKQMKQVAVERNKSKTTYGYGPHELRDIRAFCLNSNNIHDMLMWTVTIVGIRLYARASDILGLRVEDFCTGLFVCNEKNVHSLYTTIYGKGERQHGRTAILALHDDVECPEFSACRAVMAWLMRTGITSGKIFPSREELDNHVRSSSVGMHYDTYRDRHIYFCKHVLKKEEVGDEIVGGTHMLRKTGYLISVWGLPEDQYGHIGPVRQQEILQDARHSLTAGNAIKYIQDASLRKHSLIVLGQDSNHNFKVGPYVPIRLLNISGHRSVNRESEDFFRQFGSLPKLADWYVFVLCRVPRTGFQSLSNSNLMAAVDAFCPLPSGRQTCDAVCNKHNLSDEARRDMIALMREVAREAVQQDRKRSATQAQLQDPSPPAERVRAPAPAPAAVVKLSRDYQAESNKGKPSVRLKIFIEAVKEIKAMRSADRTINLSSFSEATKRWALRVGKPVACCQSCFHNDEGAFLAALENKLAVAKFVCPNGKVHDDVLGIDE